MVGIDLGAHQHRAGAQPQPQQHHHDARQRPIGAPSGRSSRCRSRSRRSSPASTALPLRALWVRWRRPRPPPTTRTARGRPPSGKNSGGQRTASTIQRFGVSLGPRPRSRRHDDGDEADEHPRARCRRGSAPARGRCSTKRAGRRPWAMSMPRTRLFTPVTPSRALRACPRDGGGGAARPFAGGDMRPDLGQQQCAHFSGTALAWSLVFRSRSARPIGEDPVEGDGHDHRGTRARNA